MFRFEKLDVWRKAVDFASMTYSITKSFPDEERFGLTSQMRRSSVSISSNIAEGSGRASDKDFARMLDIGYGSLMECVSQSYIAKEQAFMNASDFETAHAMAEELARMMSGLRKSLLG